MAARAGCPLYSTADILTATAYESEIPGPAAGTYLACTADERQALSTNLSIKNTDTHAVRVDDAPDRLGQ